MHELLIAEKAKAAEAIARALFPDARRSTYYGIRFFISASAIIVPLSGHIADYDVRVSGWNRIDPRDIVTNSRLLVKRYDTRYERFFLWLARTYQPISRIIIATDADEEGENIGTEALELLQRCGVDAPVVRMWMHSLQPGEIRRAYHELRDLQWSVAASVEARRIIDAIVGFSGTRELTLTLRPYLPALGTQVLSIGRVQTPTLSLLVERERKIRAFTPKPFWKVVIEAGPLKIERGPFSSEADAQKLQQLLAAHRVLHVVGVEQRHEARSPLPPLHTTRALQLINQFIGIPAQRALSILERLYLNGLITYPRTSTDRYGRYKIDHRSCVSAAARTLGAKPPTRLQLSVNGSVDAGDHPPITPLKQVSLNTLPRAQRAIYEFICRHYLALFYPPAQLLRVTLQLQARDLSLRVTGYRIRNPGFLTVYKYIRIVELPTVKRGDTLTISQVSVVRSETKPPPALTESKLLKQMEELKLGTKSTRPEMIEVNLERGYAVRTGRSLRATDLGMAVISLLEKAAPGLVNPRAFNREVREIMDAIASGKLHLDEALRAFRTRYLSVFDQLRAHRTLLIQEVQKLLKQRTITQCPSCGGSMVLATGSRGGRYLLCLNCQVRLPVPRKGDISPAGYCPRCFLPLFVVREKTRTYKYCPSCGPSRYAS